MARPTFTHPATAIALGSTPPALDTEQVPSGEIDRRANVLATELSTVLGDWALRDGTEPPLELIAEHLTSLRSALLLAFSDRPDLIGRAAAALDYFTGPEVANGTFLPFRLHRYLCQSTVTRTDIPTLEHLLRGLAEAGIIWSNDGPVSSDSHMLVPGALVVIAQKIAMNDPEALSRANVRHWLLNDEVRSDGRRPLNALFRIERAA